MSDNQDSSMQHHDEHHEHQDNSHTDFQMLMSEDGLKQLTHIDYFSKFKEINWTSDLNKELPIKLSPSPSFGSEVPLTLSQCFLRQVQSYSNEVCMLMKRKSIELACTLTTKNTQLIQSYTWQQFFDQAMTFAKALHLLDVEERTCIAFMGYNTPTHFVSLMGTILANCVFTEIYITNGADACLQQLVHSESKVIVCDTYSRFKEKFLPHKERLIQAGISKVILFDQLSGDYQGKKKKNTKINIYTWPKFMEIGSKLDNQTIMNGRFKNQQPGMCCNIVYTSGTTGDAKGVMLSHDNMTWYWSVLNKVNQVKGEDTNATVIHQVSYLPMSHITAQMSDFVRLLCYHQPIQLTFAQPDALQGSLLETLKEARPTEFMAVPRVYEKFKELIQSQISSHSPLVRSVFKWAQNKGYGNTLAQIEGDLSPFGYNVAKFFILNRIKLQLGLDRAEKLYYGAAPLSKETKKFFASLNMPLMNMYGLSETSGPTNFMELPLSSLDKAGKAFPGTQIKIFNPDEQGVGEICIKGRNVFMGYLNNPRETQDAFDPEGYFHSGDIGYFDSHGNLDITGRLKELIITAGGENVSPLPIEQALKEACPLISHAVIIGDERKYLSCLITLRVKYDNSLGKPTNELSPEVIDFISSNLNSKCTSVGDVMSNPEVLTFIQKCVDQVNAKSISRVNQIKKWKILDRDLSVDGGELTPTMKMKRKYIAMKYGDVIDLLYSEHKL